MNSLSGGKTKNIYLKNYELRPISTFLDEPNQSLDLQSEKLLIDLLMKEKKKKQLL